MSGWLGSIGTNSVAVAAATSSGDGCSQNGHNNGNLVRVVIALNP